MPSSFNRSKCKLGFVRAGARSTEIKIDIGLGNHDYSIKSKAKPCIHIFLCSSFSLGENSYSTRIKFEIYKNHWYEKIFFFSRMSVKNTHPLGLNTLIQLGLWY